VGCGSWTLPLFPQNHMPLCCLADLGADVVTVEPPPRRRSGASIGDIPAYGSERARQAGLNPIFRSRRSIVVDLKTEEGREVVLRFAQTAHVFMEGFRPGVCDRLGVGYQKVASRHPKVVYCSLTGYGQTGPLAQQAGLP